MYKYRQTLRLYAIQYLNKLVIIVSLGIVLSGCGYIEQQAWEKARTTNTKSAYLEFIQKYADSQYVGEAEVKSRNFLAKIIGQGEISLPVREQHKRKTRIGPIIELLPQWEVRLAELDENSLFATDKNGRKVNMRYFIPIELGNHTVKTSPKSPQVEGEFAVQETWIPPVNTFATRYNAFGTNDNQIYFVLEFNNKEQAMKFGIIFEKDYADLTTIHALGRTIQVN